MLVTELSSRQDEGSPVPCQGAADSTIAAALQKASSTNLDVSIPKWIWPGHGGTEFVPVCCWNLLPV